MNILLVDDQMSVVNGLFRGINWKRIGISGVFKAFSAAEAKLLFRNVCIDILLTDIEMPGESGIDLVNWAREQGYETEYIFLTSHADFTYARNALKAKAFDYILQPSPYEDIEIIIEKAIDTIQQNKKQEKLSRYGEWISNDFLIQRNLFYSSLKVENGYLSLERLLLKDNDSRILSGNMAIVHVSSKNINFDCWEDELLEFTLHNIISEKANDFGEKVLLCQIDPLCFALYFYGAEESFSTALFSYQIDYLRDQFREGLGIDTFFLCAAAPFPLSQIYKQFQILMKKNEEYVKQINEERMLETLGPDSHNKRAVDLVLEYIDKHLEEEISRKSLAQMVHMNVDYFSRIFKMETGDTLNDYVIKKRMECARNLLRTSVLPVGLIAAKVGYDNFSYFSKVYKKVMGISPTEERILDKHTNGMIN